MFKNLYALNIVFIALIIILQKCLQLFCTIEVKVGELGACAQLATSAAKASPLVNGLGPIQPNGKCKQHQRFF